MSKISLLIAVLFLSAPPAIAYNSGSYSKFAYASWGKYQVRQISQFVKAIEDGQLQSIAYNRQFSSVMKRVIPEVKDLGPYYENSLFGKDFNLALSRLVLEFGCLEYRYRHSMPHARECGAYVEDERLKEHFPFSGGYFHKNILAVYQNSKSSNNNVAYSLYLKEGQRFPAGSIWYPVHQLGPFFGRATSSKQLVLTVSVVFEKLDVSGAPEKYLFEKARVFWLILPEAKDIAAQANELAAGRYAAKHAQVLIAEF
ncbi:MULTISPECIES: hypothetical protein [unclassified Agarivorans]|uniref:hypothetical protein n=1 Tax=unclassified Agarivorans TaxID=2636026 RepID=UPI003D7E162E